MLTRGIFPLSGPFFTLFSKNAVHYSTIFLNVNRYSLVISTKFILFAQESDFIFIKLTKFSLFPFSFLKFFVTDLLTP